MPITETTYSSITDAAAMFNLKEDMKAGGWSVAISSDGTTYNGSGDVITTSATGAGGIDNADAYFVLRRDDCPDWLIERRTDAQAWDFSHSITGAFAGGNATTPPTAGDEVLAFLGGTYLLFPAASGL